MRTLHRSSSRIPAMPRSHRCLSVAFILFAALLAMSPKAEASTVSGPFGSVLVSNQRIFRVDSETFRFDEASTACAFLRSVRPRSPHTLVLATDDRGRTPDISLAAFRVPVSEWLQGSLRRTTHHPPLRRGLSVGSDRHRASTRGWPMVPVKSRGRRVRCR